MAKMNAYTMHIGETKEIMSYYPLYMQITGPMKELENNEHSDKEFNSIYYQLVAQNTFASQTKYYLERKSIRCSEYEWDDMLYSIDMESELRLNLTTTNHASIDSGNIQWVYKKSDKVLTEKHV